MAETGVGQQRDTADRVENFKRIGCPYPPRTVQIFSAPIVIAVSP